MVRWYQSPDDYIGRVLNRWIYVSHVPFLAVAAVAIILGL